MTSHSTATLAPAADSTTTDLDCSSCTEDRRARQLSRRGLLRGALAAGTAVAVSEHVTMRPAHAASLSGSDTLVVLFLRGGFDGLNAVVPVTDDDYYSLRPKIGIPQASTVQLDSRFGLHPALSPLKPFYDNGSLGFVHATGMTEANRSHFSAMEEIERAAPGSSIRTGWLDRTIGLTAANTTPSPLRSTSIGYRAPRSTAGPNNEVTMRSVKEFDLAGNADPAGRARWDRALRDLHAGATTPVVTPALTTLDALGAAGGVAAAGYTPAGGANYPDSPLGKALQNAAQLVKSPQPVAVITVDEGDWDMHVDLGTVGSGWMRDKLTDLGKALAAFATDLGNDLDRVTLVTMSEFGRRTEENGSGGVDHGWGNAMFLLGGGVVGGQVHGTWPGLSPTNLYQGDLRATTDYRAVLADVLQNRCKATVDQAREVFPGWTGSSLGVTKTRV
ncbi:MAG: DUF1501 domain-containing protein [Angustibacter sp.]